MKDETKRSIKIVTINSLESLLSNEVKLDFLWTSSDKVWFNFNSTEWNPSITGYKLMASNDSDTASLLIDWSNLWTMINQGSNLIVWSCHFLSSI